MVQNMQQTNTSDLSIGLYETILFLLFNFIYLMIGFILWHVLWVSRHGVEIPNLISKNTITYFSSRNFSLVLKDLYYPLYLLIFLYHVFFFFVDIMEIFSFLKKKIYSNFYP